MLLPSPAEAFSGPSPLLLVIIFYCLSFETSLFVVSTTGTFTVEVFEPASTRATTLLTSEYVSDVTTDGQSPSLSWNKAPVWGLRPDFCYCPTIAGLLMWDALSDERTGLSFAISAGPRNRSHSRVRVPWDSRS
jgi:hypothetical protein